MISSKGRNAYDQSYSSIFTGEAAKKQQRSIIIKDLRCGAHYSIPVRWLHASSTEATRSESTDTDLRNRDISSFFRWTRACNWPIISNANPSFKLSRLPSLTDCVWLWEQFNRWWSISAKLPVNCYIINIKLRTKHSPQNYSLKILKHRNTRSHANCFIVNNNRSTILMIIIITRQTAKIMKEKLKDLNNLWN